MSSETKIESRWQQAAIAIGRYIGVGGLSYLALWSFTRLTGVRDDYWALAFWSIIPAALPGIFWIDRYRDGSPKENAKAYATSAFLVWIAMMLIYFSAFFLLALPVVLSPIAVVAIWNRELRRKVIGDSSLRSESAG